MIYPVTQPSEGEALGSINEPAELVSEPVTEARVNVEESRGTIGGTIEGRKKYRGKTCFKLTC